ncbi:MAG: dicarboxylate/amino acid:cation symporter [Deltaproteobacteria bacterium]|nr:dicarboxylate/amino acid:cation symporter [Deltaproteobacteria bacterium]
MGDASSPADDAGSSLTLRILVGMLSGFLLGLVINGLFAPGAARDAVLGVLQVGGAIFVASLKLLVVPLVFVSLVCGAASLDDVAKLGRVGGKTMALYLVTTTIAIAIAVSAGALVRPGDGFALPTDVAYSPPPAPALSEVLLGIFPTNPVQAMADGNMLQIIVFAVLFGVAMTLSGAPGKRLLAFFQDANEVVLRLVLVLMKLAPLGVFCLIAKVFAEQGFGAFAPLLKYFFLVLAVLVVHMTVVYPSLLVLLGRLNPRAFFLGFREPIAVAFGTSSSNATLPVTLRAVEHKLGVDNAIASFTIPLGATINMDGTAIMQGVAACFIAQVYGVDLTTTDYLMVVVTATLASIGTAGVPGVGLVMLAMVLRQVNLPVEGIALIIGVDRLLDMSRTIVNVTGDAAVTCIVAKSEGRLDLAKYNANAG